MTVNPKLPVPEDDLLLIREGLERVTREGAMRMAVELLERRKEKQ